MHKVTSHQATFPDDHCMSPYFFNTNIDLAVYLNVLVTWFVSQQRE
jgi:hypothetical protein